MRFRFLCHGVDVDVGRTGFSADAVRDGMTELGFGIDSSFSSFLGCSFSRQKAPDGHGIVAGY